MARDAHFWSRMRMRELGFNVPPTTRSNGDAGLPSFKNGLECDYPRSTTERSEGPTERSEGVC